METRLVNAMKRESVMDSIIGLVKDDYDYIVIDCMPSLGMLTINALTASDEVIIPVQAQYLPLKGMTQLMRSINLVQNHTNENLEIGGILMTLVDGCSHPRGGKEGSKLKTNIWRFRLEMIDPFPNHPFKVRDTMRIWKIL